MSQETIYILGHRSPDLDSVAAAIAYSELKNRLENTDIYQPAVPGSINQETAHSLKKFGWDEPPVLEDAAGKKIILVDHNEFSQAVNGVEEAEIREVLDHHKVNFKYDSPIPFCSLPWGATCSIIARRFKNSGLEIDKNLAGLMLSAILVDTVITKSPTCTDKDVEIIKELAEKAEVADWKQYGIELFKIRSSVKELGAEEIIKGDFKDFDLSQGKVGVGQVETVDLGEFGPREQELLETLQKMKQEQSYHTVILFITDIMKEGSQFLVASDDTDTLGRAFGADFSEGKAFVEGVMSRKKQVAPKLEEYFN